MERVNQLTRPMVATGSGMALLLAATVALLPFRAALPNASPALLLAVPVVIAGMLGGRPAALLTAAAGGGALSLAFVPRVGALRIDGADDAIAWVAFAAAAGLLGTYAAGRGRVLRAVMVTPGDPPRPLTRRVAAYAIEKLGPYRRVAWRRSDVAFIETAYRGVLDRPPDAAGLDHHLSELAAGIPRHRVLRKIVESPESARHLVYSPGLRALAAEFWRERHQTAPPPRPVYFLHIMKTGGTALTEALSEMASLWPRLTDLFVDNLVCLPRPLLEQAALVTGHLPYEAIAALPAGAAVCTVIREPVERTLSHHAHLAASLAAQGEGPLALDEFIASDTWAPLWRNYQARQLVHTVGLLDAWRDFSPPERSAGRVLTEVDASFPLQSLFDAGPMSVSEEDLLTLAGQRLDVITFVGVTDDLEALISRIAAYWDRPAPRRVHRMRVTDGRMLVGDVHPSLLRTIRAGTEVDLALYQRALRT
jgi:hypothetical protein